MKKKKGEETGFHFLEGINFEEAVKAKSPVRAAINQTIDQKTAVGVVMKNAMNLTGSEGDTFNAAISSYESMLGPMMEKIKELYADEEAMKEVRQRIKSGQTKQKKE